MSLVVIIFVRKHKKRIKVSCHVKIMKEKKWEGDKNGHCVKLSGSYWLYRDSCSHDSDSFYKEICHISTSTLTG